MHLIGNFVAEKVQGKVLNASQVLKAYVHKFKIGCVFMSKIVRKKIELSPSKKKLVYRILFIIFLAIFIVSSFLTIKILFIEPYLNNKAVANIKEIGYAQPVSAQIPDSESGAPEDPRPNFEKLQAINPDIKGWIKIKNTPIDYPVLYSEEYLFKDYNKKYSKYGSIFLDSICKLEKSPQNILLHGHSMNNGSMFAKIRSYRDLNFYKEHPVFIFDTPEERTLWKVFSAFITNTDPAHGELFNYLQSDFESTSAFLNYVHKVRLRSNLDIPVDIKNDDKLITLSTCTYEMPDFRGVVVARKVRENEDPNVDISAARYSANPLHPDAYHKKIRSSKPTETTFEEALKKNRVPWYTA